MEGSSSHETLHIYYPLWYTL
jgi:hypothetical protein